MCVLCVCVPVCALFSPEHAPHVALTSIPGRSHYVLVNAVLALVLVVEVTVAIVSAGVPQHLDDRSAGHLLELWGGDGDGGQAGEDDLRDGGIRQCKENEPRVVSVKFSLQRGAP